MAFDPGGFSSEFGPGTPPPQPPAPPQDLTWVPTPIGVYNLNGAASYYLYSQSNNGPVHGSFGMGQVAAYGWDGSAYGYGASVYFRGVDNWTPTAHGTEMLFFTTPSGSTAAAAGAGVTANGALWCGGSAPLAVNATDGFFGVPTMPGKPTGAARAAYASAPMVYDTTDKQLFVFSGGAWASMNPTGVYLPLTGGTVTGPVTVSGGGPANALAVDGPAGTVRQLNFTTAGVLRWRLLAGNGAESGGNAGSDFALNSYSDTGALVSAAVGITRSNGLVTLAQVPALPVQGQGLVFASLRAGAGTGTPAFRTIDPGDFTANAPANQVMAGPNGAAGTPLYRALVGADLPNPAVGTKGGVQAIAAVAHQWLNSISAAGVPSLSQPASTDLSDYLAKTTLNGVLTVGVTTIGDGVFSGVASLGQYLKFGPFIWVDGRVTFTLTYTTATGVLNIGGFPAGAGGVNYNFIQIAVTPVPGSPANTGLLGAISTAGVMNGYIVGNNYVGNSWGPSYGLASGVAYQVHFGGIYLAAGF